MHVLHNRRKPQLPTGSKLSSSASKDKSSKTMATDAKSKFTDDMRKLTSVASRWKIGKRKDKVAQSKETVPVITDSFKASPPAPAQSASQNKKELKDTTALPVKGLPQHIVAATRVSEKKWTLSDLLHSFGTYVQNNCERLHNVPSPNEVAMWVRCADRALQLNGWTINSFLLESHVVFTYMLVKSAFEQGYELYSLTDAKELVLMCLYISYTYNANEISYPLRPFLVRPDRVAFWDKCTSLSLSSSGKMLKLNRDRSYYSEVLLTLKKTSLQ